ncbi:hypothetical protein CW304_01010 [Bacillus sp. UFRGS-B20]|nr:hypothetical protein CW304_01010 [Bacillus sp. UFRGS-B20]
MVEADFIRFSCVINLRWQEIPLFFRCFVCYSSSNFFTDHSRLYFLFLMFLCFVKYLIFFNDLSLKF